MIPLQTVHMTQHTVYIFSNILKFQITLYIIWYIVQWFKATRLSWMSHESNVVDKGSMPYSSSNNNFMGVSLSDSLFSLVLEKYIVCDMCGIKSPSRSLYVTPAYSASIWVLIMQGIQNKITKVLFLCNKNTWHIESNHISKVFDHHW